MLADAEREIARRQAAGGGDQRERGDVAVGGRLDQPFTRRGHFGLRVEHVEGRALADVALLDQALEHGLAGGDAGLRGGDLGGRLLQLGPGGDHGFLDLVAGRERIDLALDLLDVGLADARAEGAAGIDRHREGEPERAADADGVAAAEAIEPAERADEIEGRAELGSGRVGAGLRGADRGTRGEDRGMVHLGQRNRGIGALRQKAVEVEVERQVARRMADPALVARLARLEARDRGAIGGDAPGRGAPRPATRRCACPRRSGGAPRRNSPARRRTRRSPGGAGRAGCRGRR